MPALVGPSDGQGNQIATGTVGYWLPGPVALPDYADVLIGKLTLPFGPRRLEVHQAPVQAEQQTLNAVFRYDRGYMPTRYVLEGYANGADPAVIQQIIAQFGNDPLAAIPLIVPIMSIADMVMLTSWDPYLDATMTWKEPVYHIELKSGQGAYTELVSGIAPVPK